jgi:hypothetical protein
MSKLLLRKKNNIINKNNFIIKDTALNKDNKDSIIIFICHNNESIESVIKFDCPILVVGNYEIYDKFKENKNIIIVRDLKYNIENEPKLLTFTAWYAIIKNELFLSYKYLCVLEYDVIIPNNFQSNLNLLCKNNIIISFIKVNKNFLSNIIKEVLEKFLDFKNIKININENFYWGATTNQCMTREILSDFVNWYYPDYLEIKMLDDKNLSWYHERLFTIYLKSKNINTVFFNGLKHIQKNSHEILNTN